MDSGFQKYNFKLALIRISATKAWKFERTSGSKQHIILTFTYFRLHSWINLRFISTHGLVVHEWGIDRKLMDSGFQKYNFQAGQIRISATKALKFDRTSGSKQHNINFHVLFDYEPGITCFVSSLTVYWYTNKALIESLLSVDSKNIIFGPR
jgi:hypothetical protein